MGIPLVDLTANYHAIQTEIDRALARVIESGAFTLGPAVSEFEADFAQYCEVSHCVTVGSGTSALELSLQVLGIGPGDEVITQANTFVATCLAISRVGATPVLVDCEPGSHLIDVSKIEERISERSRAILPVHLYGQCADMDPLLEIAAKRGLRVVEDAAQAHGARYRGRRAGSMGDLGCFSFYPSKNLGAFGDGGAITTSHADWAEQLRALRNLGSKRKHHHEIQGTNSRLDSLQAAVLHAKLPHLDAWNAQRRIWAESYRQGLAGVGDLVLPSAHVRGDAVWHLFVVETSSRDELLEHLQRREIGAGIHYPIPIHRQALYRGLGHGDDDLPVASAGAGRILSLPIYPELGEAGVDEVVGAVRDYYHSG